MAVYWEARVPWQKLEIQQGGESGEIRDNAMESGWRNVGHIEDRIDKGEMKYWNSNGELQS